MKPNPQLVESITPCQSSTQVTITNGNTFPISFIDKLTFSTHPRPLHLRDILIVPQLTTNLLSIAKFVKDNSRLIEFHFFGYVVKNFQTRIPFLADNIHNNLYLWKFPPPSRTTLFLLFVIPLSTCGINSLATHVKPSYLDFFVVYFKNLI